MTFCINIRKEITLGTPTDQELLQNGHIKLTLQSKHDKENQMFLSLIPMVSNIERFLLFIVFTAYNFCPKSRLHASAGYGIRYRSKGWVCVVFDTCISIPARIYKEQIKTTSI